MRSLELEETDHARSQEISEQVKVLLNEKQGLVQESIRLSAAYEEINTKVQDFQVQVKDLLLTTENQVNRISSSFESDHQMCQSTKLVVQDAY